MSIKIVVLSAVAKSHSDLKSSSNNYVFKF